MLIKINRYWNSHNRGKMVEISCLNSFPVLFCIKSVKISIFIRRFFFMGKYAPVEMSRLPRDPVYWEAYISE